MKPRTDEFNEQLLASYAASREVLTGFSTALNGMPDEQFSELRAKVNEALSKMPPLDQIENGQRALMALNMVSDAMAFLKDAQTRINAMCEEIKVKMSSAVPVDQAVQTALNGKLTAGELITKADHDAAIDKVKADFARRDARRAELATNGFPAGDALLAMDDAAYKAATERATDRKAKLATAKLALNGTDLDEALFGMGDASFALLLKSAAPSAARTEPLIGGGAAPAAGTAPAAPRKLMPC